MFFSPTRWLNVAAIGGIGAMMMAAGHETRATDATDSIVTGSIAENSAIRSAVLTAIDHTTDRRCELSLHHTEGYNVHRLEPGGECATLGELFARARTWRQDRQDTVTVTDHHGTVLMRLAHGDGFAFEVIYPLGLQVSLSAD